MGLLQNLFQQFLILHLDMLLNGLQQQLFQSYFSLQLNNSIFLKDMGIHQLANLIW